MEQESKLSPKYSFCGGFPETVLHLFIECELVSLIWEALQWWLKRKTKAAVDITIRNILCIV